MNRYTLSDLKPGLTESFKVTVTQKIQDSFRDMTGDINPMHVDREYVLNSGGGGATLAA